MGAANADDFAVGENEFESHDVICGHAVGQSVRATGVFRDVATDGAGLLAGRVGREVEAVRCGGQAKIEVDDAGLDDRALIPRVDGEDAVHARKNDHHPAGAGECSAGKTSTSPATHDGNVVFRGESGDLRDLLRGGRKDDDVGAAFLDRSVVFVEHDIFGLKKNARRAEQFFEIAK